MELPANVAELLAADEDERLVIAGDVRDGELWVTDAFVFGPDMARTPVQWLEVIPVAKMALVEAGVMRWDEELTAGRAVSTMGDGTIHITLDGYDGGTGGGYIEFRDVDGKLSGPFSI